MDQLSVLPCSHSTNLTVIHLLVTHLIFQMIIILLLLYNNPFRKPLLIELDRLKGNRALLLFMFVGAVVISYSITDVCHRYGFDDAVNSQIVVYRVLQASIMGFSLFLLLAIHNLHQYIKEVVMVTDTITTARKQNRDYEDGMKLSANEGNVIRTKISSLKTEHTKLQAKYNVKEQALQSKRANCSALRDKLEGLHVQYDRLLSYNEDIRDQLRVVNERSSHSNSNKSVFFSWGQWGL